MKCSNCYREACADFTVCHPCLVMLTGNHTVMTDAELEGDGLLLWPNPAPVDPREVILDVNSPRVVTLLDTNAPAVVDVPSQAENESGTLS